jgi:ubiquinone/menaquinone biosynthesis C-methylase UbiE
MPEWFMSAAWTVFVLLALTATFFFTFTRGTLILRSLRPGPKAPGAHIYPIYENMRLIRLVDWQPINSAILLFQYHRLVRMITDHMQRSDLRGRRVLITSCAFGNVIPKVADAALGGGAARLQVSDLVQNELLNAQRKLVSVGDALELRQEDAAAMGLPDASVAANVMFFLLHELPDPMKIEVLDEACRVLAPGGTLYLAEFHRPDRRLLRALGWLYFKTFEPMALALWNTHDPLVHLSAMPGLRCERRTVFFGNYQVITATRLA